MATFNPESTLFFLMGGLNDQARFTTQSQLITATTKQVRSLYDVGARYFEIALLPAQLPVLAFQQAAANVNPVMLSLIPELQVDFPDAVIALSQWGPDFDDVYTNAAEYGITNTTDPCRINSKIQCSNPDQSFFFYPYHPSDVVHRIVGQDLYDEALRLPDRIPIPEPDSLALLAVGGLAALVRRKALKNSRNHQR